MQITSSHRFEVLVQSHGFEYEIKAVVSLNGLELLTLFEASEQHYDSRVRGMSRPRDAWGQGGELWGYMNLFCDGAPEEGEETVTYFKRFCAKNPTAHATRTLTSHVIDTMAKAMEFHPLGHPLVCDGLRKSLAEAHKKIQLEHVRLNVPTERTAG